MTPSTPPPSSGHSRRLQTILLATVVVLLAAILIVLVINVGDNDETGSVAEASSDSDSSNLDKPPDKPDQTAHRFMQFIMVHRHPDKAEDLMCDDYAGPEPTELLNGLTDWESSNDVSANVAISFDDNPSHSPFTIDVEIETGPSFYTWTYDVTVEPAGESWEVCEVQEVTVED